MTANDLESVVLSDEGGVPICRVVLRSGEVWCFRGQYAEVAWVAWDTFYHGSSGIKTVVQVPQFIIRRLRGTSVKDRRKQADGYFGRC